MTIEYKKTDFNYPNLTIQAGYSEADELVNYKVTPDKGYVMSNTNNETVKSNFIKKDETPSPYSSISYLPKNYNFNNFPWVAVLAPET